MSQITIDRAVLEQALEAFEIHARQYPHMVKGYTLDAEEALRAALEQPQVEQEPVAWMFQHEETGRIMYVDAQQVEWGFEQNNPRLIKIRPAYLHPQPPRQPLTDEQIGEIVALKELNRELLVALKACDEAMSYMSEYDIPLHLPFRVKAAIAKATGGAA